MLTRAELAAKAPELGAESDPTTEARGRVQPRALQAWAWAGAEPRTAEPATLTPVSTTVPATDTVVDTAVPATDMTVHP